jgi:hypothetical protein
MAVAVVAAVPVEITLAGGATEAVSLICLSALDLALGVACYKI